jgi:predicted nucleic acid-binding protein
LPTALSFADDWIILDACCLINLCESGRTADILESIPAKVAVAQYVYDTEILRCDLQSLVDNGLITLVNPETEFEETTYVNFAVSLDDGEAITGAIAVHRNWAIATDERKAQNVFSVAAAHLQVITTPELVKHWVDTYDPAPEEIRQVLRSIREQGKYQPNKRHLLYEWWENSAL